MRGHGRIFQPRNSTVWWLDYSARGVRVKESSRSRDSQEAHQMLASRHALFKQLVPLRGVDLPTGKQRERAVEAAENNDILTKAEVAAWLKIKPRQVERLGIPCLDLGERTKRYYRTDVQTWLDAQRRTKT